MTRVSGESVAPGIAVGPVFLRGFATEGASRRIAADEVDAQLAALGEAVRNSRAQIEDIKKRQQGSLGEADLRIFDAHHAYLGDAAFAAEIEQLVRRERFCAREAVRSVFEKYDRIFQLVESDLLRRRASDLRDVAMRLLRNLEAEAAPASVAPTVPYILVARRLTTADMFNLGNEKVEAIVAEEGGMSSHAAILARSMGIPTVSGIRDVLRLLRDGDVVVLDASTGELVVAPSEEELAEANVAVQRFKEQRNAQPGQASEQGHQLRDGTPVHLLGSCGSAGEADLVRTFGMAGIGVFRTELQFLTGGGHPSEDDLVRVYRAAIGVMPSHPIAFRLLDVAAATLQPEQRNPERNPAMGRRGVRGLLANPDLLRLQLRAILRAAAGCEGVAVLVPFVTGQSDLQRVKAALLEERVSLKKAKVPQADSLRLAPIIEVPAAAMVLGALLNEADFAVIAIDDLQAHLLAADRDNATVREYHELVHPGVFEVVARLVADAEDKKKPITLFGESAADPMRVPFYLGVGYRSFSIAPVRLRGFAKILARYSLEECRRIAARILEAPRALDVQRILVNLDLG